MRNWADGSIRTNTTKYTVPVCNKISAASAHRTATRCSTSLCGTVVGGSRNCSSGTRRTITCCTSRTLRARRPTRSMLHFRIQYSLPYSDFVRRCHLNSHLILVSDSFGRCSLASATYSYIQLIRVYLKRARTLYCSSIGHLNTIENSEIMAGYDRYSSIIADVLCQPALSTPITVGLFAKWGSGKSFILERLQSVFI